MCNTLPPGHETTIFGRPFLFNITILSVFDIFPGKKKISTEMHHVLLFFIFISFYIFYHKSMSILIEKSRNLAFGQVAFCYMIDRLDVLRGTVTIFFLL